jgi:hypothetical protein
MKVSKIRGVICGGVLKGVCFRRCIPETGLWEAEDEVLGDLFE